MKSTGIVKKIDDLGRVVIPKEIRNNQKIRNGENVEIFIDKDNIILKKYSKMKNFVDFSFQLANIFNNITDYQIIITDREKIVVNTNKHLDIDNNEISDELISYMENRKNVVSKEKKDLKITNKKNITCVFSIYNLIIDSELIGLIILYGDSFDNNPPLLINKLLANIIMNYENIIH